MFIPQINEVDVYNSTGQELNDINSITELICDLVTEAYEETDWTDEDDDSDRHYGLPQPSYNTCNSLLLQTQALVSTGIHIKLTEWQDRINYLVYTDIIAPPPEA